MQRENLIVSKSYDFALKIISLYKYLTKEKKEFVLSKQLLRSGTSIGANVEEGTAGQTHKDFITKFAVAHKEAKESHYWLRLLRDSGEITVSKSRELIEDCECILRITAKILSTAKNNGK